MSLSQNKGRTRASTIAAPPPKRKQKSSIPPRRRCSTNEFGSFVPSKFLFTPADNPPPYSPRSPGPFTIPKSNSSPSSPILRANSSYDIPPFLPGTPMSTRMQLNSDSEDDRDDDDDLPYTTWGANTNPKPSSSYSKAHVSKSKSTTSLRMRIFGSVSSYASSRGRDRVKSICTTPGQLCAGETETEIDEPVCA